MYSRACPSCLKNLEYASKQGLKLAESKNNLCNKCSQNTDKRKVQRKESYLQHLGKMDFKKENNPFYGRSHSEETKDKLRKPRNLSLENRKACAERLKKYTNRRKIFDIWVEKYGIEKAQGKRIELNKIISISSSGKNNPMYGKPAPRGSGNGWKGWYKGWFFRSLRELSFMVNVIEKEGFTWESGEKKKFKVEYKSWDGEDRCYFPDFVLNGKNIIEIKPKRLWGSLTVKFKADAAKKHFENMGYTYELKDPGDMDLNLCKKLHSSGKIKFQERYEQKFQNYLGTFE